MASDPLAGFSAPTRAWFAASFPAPTEVQRQVWQAAAGGGSVLASAPTGSGKTLAGFLAAVDRLLGADPARPRGCRVLYVSPLKALAYDVERNLRAPLAGIARAAERLGVAPPDVDVGMRTGDTPAEERRRLARSPPDILITTPESLYLLLTSRARAGLAAVETVIVDEVHAVAGTKRGAHLALSLERLQALVGRGRAIQRIGLSATQRPLDEVARFLGGGGVDAAGNWAARPVTVVEVAGGKDLDVEIVVPVQDMARLGEPLEPDGGVASGPAASAGPQRRSIWPAVHPRVLELVLSHRSTIVFVNSRRLAERLCARLNELAEAPPERPLARAHHGSIAREQRLGIEDDLKAGRLRCVVATSSLELGIDMGAVDLVVQVESPGSVSAGLQRIGRAGHQVGAPSVGKLFPKFRGDLVECAVVVRRMREGAIEETRYPRNALDVLAQQIVAMVAMDDWDVEELYRVVRGAAGFAELGRATFDGVLDLLSGRYPSDEFAELRPRVTWDRIKGIVRARPGAQRLAVTSGGTIPDRGLYGVFLAGEGAGRRVGELDEEMVYETRPGEAVVLGASTWRIEDITRDQVLVVPAPGQPGKLPFWHGDAPGRPVEVGRAVGTFLRELGAMPAAQAGAVLEGDYGLDRLAATNLVAYLEEQREATGTLPDDRTIVVERFRDEIGDWRVVLHSPFGGRVHAPWALAIAARARERLGLPVEALHADDGIVVRLPEGDGEHDELPLEAVLVDPDDVEDLVVAEVADSALFAARFRECAARALLLPRRVGSGGGPGGMRRTPLWQQRQRAADLLAVAARYPSFPMLLETYRECLRDVFDLPALVQVLREVASRRVRVVAVDTPVASPFAASLLFDYVAGFMYEGDAPLAERRASALALDRRLLAELLGSEELRELHSAEALARLELVLQRLDPQRRARHPDAVHDLLLQIGDLSRDEVAARTEPAVADKAERWLADLESQRRAYRLRVAGEERWAAAEDAARFRDALGIPAPAGLPDAFLTPVERPLVDLVARYARTHGPFRPDEVAARLGLSSDAVRLALTELERDGRVAAGEFRPGGTEREWCDVEVLRRLRRASLAELRRDVEPVEPDALVRFLPAWQGVVADPGAGARPLSPAAGLDRTLETVQRLQGAALPASVLEADVMAARVPGYNPAWLDELCAAGEVVWVGSGPLGSGDGRVGLYLREEVGTFVAPPAPGDEDRSQPHRRLLEHLRDRGASFWPALRAAAGGDEAAALEALWDLVWAGLVTNDTLAPLRATVAGGRRTTPRRPGVRRRRPGAGGRSGPARAAGRWSLVADLLAEPEPDSGALTAASPASTPSAPATGGRPATAAVAAATGRAAALAARLLDRHGILTRAGASAEDLPGGFAAIYPALKAMEESGRARRGYFVEGLGGSQFALPGAVERLRSAKEPEPDSGGLVLAATDPANPFGAALGWPTPGGQAAGSRPRHGPRRVAGAHVVVVDGRLVAYLEKGGRSVLTFTGEAAALAAAAAALAGLVDAGRVGRLRIERIDGEPVSAQALVPHLRAAGFADHPRGLLRR